jgi:NADH-quinone oxidoreductase subunit F
MTDSRFNQTCFATLQYEQPWTLENYYKVGGYEAWKKIIREKITPEQVFPRG